MRGRLWVAAAAALAVSAVAPALAEPAQCGLNVFGQLDMIENGSGAILVPVTLNGRNTVMMIDTGAVWSGIPLSAVPGVKPFDTVFGEVGAGGGVTHSALRVPEFKIGSVTLQDVDFMQFPEAFTADPRGAGNIRRQSSQGIRPRDRHGGPKGQPFLQGALQRGRRPLFPQRAD